MKSSSKGHNNRWLEDKLEDVPFVYCSKRPTSSMDLGIMASTGQAQV